MEPTRGVVDRARLMRRRSAGTEKWTTYEVPYWTDPRAEKWGTVASAPPAGRIVARSTALMDQVEKSD